MSNRKLFSSLILSGVLVALVACDRRPNELKRIEIMPNPFFKVVSGPVLLAKELSNPQSPFFFEGNVVFSQSGKGDVSMVSEKGGPITSLITGFEFDNFSDYKISVQGILIDPVTKEFIVCSAAGPGRLYAFSSARFPTTVAAGREIVLEGAVEDNPYDVVLAAGRRIIIASGGTAKAYGAPFPLGDPWIMKPVFVVNTGITGLAIDPKSGDVFGAVFGTSKPDGSVIRFQPTLEQPSIKTVATGFTNLVDVAFTPDGQLLALEFGSFANDGKQDANNGTLSIVATDGSGTITPFIRGLANPSSISVAENGRLFITEFGNLSNAQSGTLISISLAKAN